MKCICLCDLTPHELRQLGDALMMYLQQNGAEFDSTFDRLQQLQREIDKALEVKS